jgi:hypothetical protein
MSDLRLGQTVIWRGAWGTAEPVEAVVRYIQKNESNGSKSGRSVGSIPWSEVTERNVIVDLENGFWAWGSQISEKEEIKLLT